MRASPVPYHLDKHKGLAAIPDIPPRVYRSDIPHTDICFARLTLLAAGTRPNPRKPSHWQEASVEASPETEGC
jgi:hypothetical protein